MKKRTLAMAVATITASMSATAAFYVVDEPIQIKSTVVEQTTPYEIPFFKGLNSLGPKGSKAAAEVLTNARSADTVEIIGRPDSANQSSLALLRSYALRDYLTSNGIDPAIITVSTSNARPQQRNIFASNIILKRKQTTGLTTNVATARSMYDSLPITSAGKTSAAPVSVATDVRIGTLQRILKMAKDGIIAPADAINVMAELLEATKVSAPATPTQIIVRQQNMADQITVSQWSLAANKSLRQNLNDWATLAGWKPLIWDIPSDFDVTYSSVIEGDFMVALEKVSTAANLDFFVRKSAKEIRVTVKK